MLKKCSRISKGWLCADRDETIHQRSESSKLEQRDYKTIIDSVRHWKLYKKIEIRLYYQMVYVQTRMRPGEWDARTSLRFWDTIRSPNPGLETIHKKENQTNSGLCFPSRPQIESERKQKREISTWTLLKNWKELWNIMVMVIRLAISSHRTVSNGLLMELDESEIEGRVETIQISALLRSTRILCRVLETWVGLLSLIERLLANTTIKNPQGVI